MHSICPTLTSKCVYYGKPAIGQALPLQASALGPCGNVPLVSYSSLSTLKIILCGIQLLIRSSCVMHVVFLCTIFCIVLPYIPSTSLPMLIHSSSLLPIHSSPQTSCAWRIVDYRFWSQAIIHYEHITHTEESTYVTHS